MYLVINCFQKGAKPMITWHEELSFDFSNSITDRYFTEHALFFDIETTGFSAAHTSLYLIGCATRHGSQIHLDQFFAEKKEDEPEVLRSFSTLLAQYDTIISFNGIGFDIPYLKAKYSAHGIPDPFVGCSCLDLYKKISRLKTLLSLPDLKQKSIEAFLGLTREDTCSGGELIEVYRTYRKSPSADALALLRQHNHDDVLCMPRLLPILSYCSLFDSPHLLTAMEADEAKAPDGTVTRGLLFTMQIANPVPKQVSLRHDDCYLTASGNSLRLHIRLFDGVLSFFFDNPKDYYYLPAEDRAVHKSLASYVDPAHRRQATAATCYTKKHALFLPQYDDLFSPAFRQKPKGSGRAKSYFELTESFADSAEEQTRYVHHLLSHMIC